MTIIRKAKKNWIEGKRGVTLGFEIQQSKEQAHHQLISTPSFSDLYFSVMHKAYDETGTLIDQNLESMSKKLAQIVTETMTLRKARVKTIPAIASLLATLIKACNSVDLDRYASLIKKWAELDDHTLGLRIKILSGLAEHANPVQLRQLMDVHDALDAHPTLLNAISGLFASPPYPHIPQFIEILKKNKKDLKAYIQSFDRDPKGTRAASYNEEGKLIKSAEQIINEQFDTSQLRRVITELEHEVNERNLNSQYQYHLAQQVTYINAIGKDYPFTVRKKTHTNLTQSSRLELTELIHVLIGQIKNPNLNTSEKIKLRLNTLAVLRELYFRTTGEFINTTQLMSILLALNNDHENKLLAIGSGERKSATIAILSAMKWIETGGRAVDVCLSGRELVHDHFQARGAKNFFTTLGIPSAMIQAGDRNNYQTEGVNYSTLADLAIYHEQNSNTGSDRLPAYTNLIISGFNASDINERTVFNLVRPKNNKENLYVWIYLQINEFIDQKTFMNLNPQDGAVWDNDRDVLQLRTYLEDFATTEIQKDQLTQISTEQLNDWLNSACIAQQLEYIQDYTLNDHADLAGIVATPKYLKLEQKEWRFSKQIQQFLHARLQQKYLTSKLVIESESEQLATASLGDLLNRYKKHGEITGIFNTLTNEFGVIEKPGALNSDVAYKVPAHKTNKLGRFHPEIPTSQYLERIIDQITRATKGQPIVLVAQDVHQVQQLELALQSQNAKKGNSLTIHTFTGMESEDQRQQWIADFSGQNDTITITTAVQIKDSQLTTSHAKGFFTIQTYLDTPEHVRELMDRVAAKDRPGRYVTFHEEQGALFSNSWFFQSEEERENVITGISQIHKKHQEERALVQHVAFNSFNIRQTVLKQFGEWQEFLQLVTPPAQWSSLKRELLIQKDDLICSLKNELETCLEHYEYLEYYEVNLNNTDKKLQSEYINNTLKYYEIAVNTLWEEKLAFFKEKSKEHIQAGSINALRYKYLTQVDLTEQWHITQLQIRQRKKAVIRERQMNTRHVDFALDVNGAMLAYTDCSLESFRRSFTKNQLKLLSKDVIQQIKLSSLDVYTQSLLIQRIKGASDFLTLELVLNYFNDLLGSQYGVEKYRMQPIIIELVRAYQYAGIPESDELKKLKKSYIDSVAFEIVDQLEQSLSWAKVGNQGLDYWLERTAVKTAAQELLAAIHQVKNTQDSVSRQKALRELYRLLIQQQVQLEELWIFSFGHANTRDLINHTLKTIENLTTIGPAPEQIDASFIQNCKEEVYYDMMHKQFDAALEKVEKDSPSLPNNSQWIQIKKQIHAMQKDNPTIFANSELYYFLSKTSKDLIYTNSPIFKPLIELRGTARNIGEKFYPHHKNQLNESQYFALKAKNIQLALERLPDYKVQQVTIKSSQTGFNDSFDLIITGKGALPLLDGFLHYQPRIQELTRDRNDLQQRLAMTKIQIGELNKFQLEQTDNPKQTSTIKPELLKASSQAIISEYFTLKGYINGNMPVDLSKFSKQEQHYFLDRKLTSTFHSTQFTLEQIAQLKDVSLKADFTELYNKINKKPKSRFSQWIDWFPLIGSREESPEDLAYHFANLINSPGRELERAFRPQMNKKREEVAKLLSDAQAEEKELMEQIRFLDVNIDKEKQQAGVISKRFENLEQLYDFEIALRTQCAAQSLGTVAQKESEVVIESEMVIKEDYFSKTSPTVAIIDDHFDETPAGVLGV